MGKYDALWALLERIINNDKLLTNYPVAWKNQIDMTRSIMIRYITHIGFKEE